MDDIESIFKEMQELMAKFQNDAQDLIIKMRLDVIDLEMKAKLKMMK